MFDEAARQRIGALGESIGVDPAALLAVAEVESAGRAFDTVDGKDTPLIRWEGHYFYRLLPQSLKKTALTKGLAHPNAGGVLNPKSQQARYNLLERAKQIDEVDALSSCLLVAAWTAALRAGQHFYLRYVTGHNGHITPNT